MLTSRQLADPKLVGSLVQYDDGFGRVDYGLVKRVSETTPGWVFVRFHLGSTAEACAVADLTVKVGVLDADD